MPKPEMKCADCGTVMVEKVKIETGNCPDGCCPDYLVIMQCPQCKRIDRA